MKSWVLERLNFLRQDKILENNSGVVVFPSPCWPENRFTLPQCRIFQDVGHHGTPARSLKRHLHQLRRNKEGIDENYKEKAIALPRTCDATQTTGKCLRHGKNGGKERQRKT